MLPKAADIFTRRNLVISSVAGSLEEETIRALGDANIPILRICVPIDMEIGYMASVEDTRQKIRELAPVLESSRVKVGIQKSLWNNGGELFGNSSSTGRALSRDCLCRS